MDSFTLDSSTSSPVHQKKKLQDVDDLGTRFHIERELGKGAFGSVVEAFDHKL